jgi:hypothetical protein
MAHTQRKFSMSPFRTGAIALSQVFLSLTLANACLFADKPEQPAEQPNWMTDYAAARNLAIADKKMLLIYFRGPNGHTSREAFESKTLDDPTVQDRCQRYVLLRIDTAAKVKTADGDVELLKHGSFQAMNGDPGLAIVDMKHSKESYFKFTVGCLPFESPVYYAPQYYSVASVRTFLDLPPGTLTQRTMIYAVRMHPETPASTSGFANQTYFQACASHSGHQARIRLQGHHNWSSRAGKLMNQVAGAPPVEVCAESWPNPKSLLAACIDCVHSWRQSSGHWSAVRRAQPGYGYDIAKGSNGIWYATGIFGGSKSPTDP